MKTTCTKKRHNRKKSNFLKAISVLCLLFISTATLQAQETKATTAKKDILVKGNVSDETGPLLGVNILLQGTSIGTSTDIDGNFEFPKRLKKGDVLVFSSIGFRPQKIVIDSEESVSNIKLKIDMQLDEVVIIGKAASKKVFKSKRN